MDFPGAGVPPGQTLSQASTAGVVIGVYIPFTILSLTFLLVRLYTRAILLRFIGKDDILITIAWFFAFGTLICVFYGIIHDGVGKHFWNLGPNDVNNFNAIEIQVVWIHQWALMFTRISILTFYLRVWPTKSFKILCYVMIALNVAYGVVFLAVDITNCSPVEKFWKPYLPGTCRNQQTLNGTVAILNIVFDLAIYVLPFPMLRRLNVNQKQKTALYVTFGLGLAAVTFSIVRLPFILKFNPLNDGLFNQWNLVIWSAMELNIGIICACIPALKALLRKVLPGTSLANYYNKAASSIARTRNAGHSHHNHTHNKVETRSRSTSKSSKTSKGSRSSTLVGDSKPCYTCQKNRASCMMHNIELKPLDIDLEMQRLRFGTLPPTPPPPSPPPAARASPSDAFVAAPHGLEFGVQTSVTAGDRPTTSSSNAARWADGIWMKQEMSFTTTAGPPPAVPNMPEPPARVLRSSRSFVLSPSDRGSFDFTDMPNPIESAHAMTRN